MSCPPHPEIPNSWQPTAHWPSQSQPRSLPRWLLWSESPANSYTGPGLCPKFDRPGTLPGRCADSRLEEMWRSDRGASRRARRGGRAGRARGGRAGRRRAEAHVTWRRHGSSGRCVHGGCGCRSRWQPRHPRRGTLPSSYHEVRGGRVRVGWGGKDEAGMERSSPKMSRCFRLKMGRVFAKGKAHQTHWKRAQWNLYVCACMQQCKFLVLPCSSPWLIKEGVSNERSFRGLSSVPSRCHGLTLHSTHTQYATRIQTHMHFLYNRSERGHRGDVGLPALYVHGRGRGRRERGAARLARKYMCIPSSHDLGDLFSIICHDRTYPLGTRLLCMFPTNSAIQFEVYG